MKRTVEEKLAYNRKRAAFGSEFAEGYCLGVELYVDYMKECDEVKEGTRTYIDIVRKRQDLFAKGVMCGYRDAAVDRKARHSHC